MMKYYYFPGCSLDSSAVTYKNSIDYVAEQIGLELHEIPDWNCCGATAAHTKNERLALALPARNLSLAQLDGKGHDIAVPCASCYSRMKHSVYEARNNEDKRLEIEEILEMPFDAKQDVFSFLDVFSKPEIMEACEKAIGGTLEGLKVACYYGCLTSRPRHIVTSTDSEEVIADKDPENPMQMDKIIALTGAQPIEWDFKTECCGASHQVDAPADSRQLIEKIFANAKANGARAIVTACPLCNLNLDMREEEINKARKTAFDLPVYQFTELLAVCMGASAKEIGLHKHFYPAFERINTYLRRAGGR